MIIVAFVIAFSASIIGSISGIGGGVLMKPLFELFGIASLSATNFLSGMTVLSMAGYNTLKKLFSGDSDFSFREIFPIAVGAAVGGLAGSRLLEALKSLLAYPDKVGMVQAVLLAAVCMGTIAYSISKNRLKTLHISGGGASAAIGMALGLLSSFLGIGGGPFNLAVLSFFFSMDTKHAVQSSLTIILFSQAFSIASTVFGGRIPPFEPLMLALMICGGIGGAIIGSRIGKKLSNEMTDKVFIVLLIVVILICIYNMAKY